jgi:hypothetical protein
MVSSTGKRSLPSRARRARSPRSRPAWAKRLAPHQHRRQKCHEGGGGINPIGPVPLDRHVAPNLPSQIDLSQAGNEDGHAAEGSDCPFGLAQNQPLVRQQRSDPPQNGFVRGIGFRPSVVSKAYHPNEAQLRNSGLVGYVTRGRIACTTSLARRAAPYPLIHRMLTGRS